MALSDHSRSPSPSSENEPQTTDRQLLSNAIQRVVNALGGLVDDIYVPGDSCHGCLKDLKRLWRLDDHDDDRTVARILWETQVFMNDLVPILLVTEDRCVVACVDIMTAMTWPIDLTEELKELEEVDDLGRLDYTLLLNSHIAYKRTMVNQPKAFRALLDVMLPSLAKQPKERVPRDTQIISLILHLIRNLAFIQSDQSEFITALQSSKLLDLLLTLASNAMHNNIVLDIFHLMLRGIPPKAVLSGQEASKSVLTKALEAEKVTARQNARHANSRHNRFGTTIAVRQHNASFILHKQSAITRDPGELLDASKKATRRTGPKGNDEQQLLSHKASNIMREFCCTFIESCFNSFLGSLLKDIRAERPHITEKDNLRLLSLTRWFLEFFISLRKEKNWKYGLIGEIVDRGWIVWILKRMRNAMEEKPKLYIEHRLGTECLTQLFLLLDSILSNPESPEDFKEAAETLQYQLYYNGEVLDIAFDGLKEWKEGGQMGVKSLQSSVHLSYILLRMLERWGKNTGDVYVRKRARKKAQYRRRRGEEEVPDVEDAPDDGETESMIQEQMFTFEKYEQKFADEDIARALMSYLSRYRDFDSAEQMKHIVGLIHRQAVKAKAEGLFFKVSTLSLFKTVLNEERMFPKEQPYKDLKNLIEFLLKKFFKAAREDPFLLVEAFFPKNRGKWKAYSSWIPETREGRRKKKEDLDLTGEVKVKRGHKWSEQLGIAIKCLVESGKMVLVEWVREILMMVIRQRQRIIEDTDGSSSQQVDEDDEESIRKLDKPSSEAVSKFENYYIPYVTDEQANAATKDPYLKLTFRLIKGHIDDETAEELAWYIPASILPSDLSSCLTVIDQFLENPIDLGNKKATQMLTRAKRRQRRRSRTPDSGASNTSDDEDEQRAQKKRKVKEVEKYKSAQFIEDSDAEFDEEAFFAKERERRARNEDRAKQGLVVAMKPTGTKKRKTIEETKRKQKRAKPSSGNHDEQQNSGEVGEGANSESELADVTTPQDRSSSDNEHRPKSRRPRPRRFKSRASSATQISEGDHPKEVFDSENGGPDQNNQHDNERDEDDEDLDVMLNTVPLVKKRGRLVISDEEE